MTAERVVQWPAFPAEPTSPTSPMARVVAALTRAGSRRGSGSDWNCPAHDDIDPSLGVDEGEDGRVVLYCGVGCPTAAVLDALGLTFWDIGPDGAEHPPEVREHAPKYQDGIPYDYHDESGVLLFQVIRRECKGAGAQPCPLHKKRFRQRAPRSAGWRTGKGALDGVRRVPYRLPELLAAAEAHKAVVIVEGEKDANRVAAEGMAATTAPGGVKGWDDEWSPRLRGASVVTVVADRDSAGYARARTTVESLRRAGVSPVRVALPKPTHRKADYSDHAAAGYGFEELVEVELADLVWREDAAEAAASESPEVLRELGKLRVSDRARQLFRAEQRDAALRSGMTRAPIDGASFILDGPPEQEPLWGLGDKVLWAEGEGLLIVGPQGVGKSTTAQAIVLRRAGITDDELWGFPVEPEDQRTLYLAMDRPDQIRRSLRRMVTENDRGRLKERLAVWRGPLPFDPLADSSALADWILREYGSDIGSVIVDSYKDLAPGLVGDEVGARLNLAMQEVIARGIQWLGLHHQRKATGENKRPNTLADVYGSVWLTAGVGSVVLLWGEPGGSAVEAIHLKQPLSPVGPLSIGHDHATGASDATEPIAKALDFVARAAAAGVTEAQVATELYGSADLWQRRRAKRLLEKLAADYGLRFEPGGKGGSGGGGQPARWWST